MNNIINWIAVNNTLMIKIGFTAILALLVIYVFRYFFMPKVNVVNESLDSAGGAKSGALDEADIEKRKIVEQKQAEYYTSEIEKLLIEIAKLKDQLMETNTIVTDLKEKNQELTVQAQNVTAQQDNPPPEANGSSSAEYIVTLKGKVENLEARLSEYEIIAEDISEIGQLRKDNAELRKQLTEAPAANEKLISDELMIVDESIPEVEEPAPLEKPVLAEEPAPDLAGQLNEAELDELISNIEAEASAEIAPEPEIEIAEPVVEPEIEIAPETKIEIAEPQIEPEVEIALEPEIEIASPLIGSEAEEVAEGGQVSAEAELDELLSKIQIANEVPIEERDMLDHFEEITKKKGS